MRKHFRPLSALLLLTALLILPYFVFAQTDTPSGMLGKLNEVAENGGYNTAGPGLLTVVGIIIQAALGLLGAIFLIIMVIAGYNWMTSSGNEQRVEKAKSMISRAIIGLVITLSSWAVWTFILQRLIIG